MKNSILSMIYRLKNLINTNILIKKLIYDLYNKFIIVNKWKIGELEFDYSFNK